MDIPDQFNSYEELEEHLNELWKEYYTIHYQQYNNTYHGNYRILAKRTDERRREIHNEIKDLLDLNKLACQDAMDYANKTMARKNSYYKEWSDVLHDPTLNQSEVTVKIWDYAYYSARYIMKYIVYDHQD
jgi:hypothetical protein